MTAWFTKLNDILNAWLGKLYETFIATNYYTMMLDGLKNTVIITLGALVIGVLIGTMIAIVKYLAEDAPAWKPLAGLCDVYVTVIRGVPVVVLLLVFYFIILTSANGIFCCDPYLRHQFRCLHGGAGARRHRLCGCRTGGGLPQFGPFQISNHAQGHLAPGCPLYPARHWQ